MLCSPLRKKGDSQFPMTTFCCNKKVIPKLTLVLASFSGLSTPLAADEVLEEITVSGVKDPRSGSLISSGSSRLVSPTDLVTPAFHRRIGRSISRCCKQRSKWALPELQHERFQSFAYQD